MEQPTCIVHEEVLLAADCRLQAPEVYDALETNPKGGQPARGIDYISKYDGTNTTTGFPIYDKPSRKVECRPYGAWLQTATRFQGFALRFNIAARWA